MNKRFRHKIRRPTLRSSLLTQYIVWRQSAGILALFIISSTAMGQETPIYSYSVPSGGYAPNGNLVQYTDQLTGTWTMQYDNLNRLTQAAANAGYASGLVVNWNYDSFGNRTSQAYSGTSSIPLPSATSVNYGPNNTITGSSAAPSGVLYDTPGNGGNVGNVTFDGINQMAYDAENRLCATYNTMVGGPITQYLYNAEGQRVAQGHPTTGNSLACPTDMTNFTLTATYILGPSGEQVTELDGGGNWQHSNIYSGGNIVATYDSKGVHFSFADPLGTKRIQASTVGVVELTCFSLPFGDGPPCTIPSDAPVSADEATENRFTGKERDSESGLDYFGARYYASSMGRWMSPDLPFADQDPANPQSWNLYGYVRNNPLNSIDDSGLLTIIIGGTGYNPHDWNYSHSPLTGEAQAHFADSVVGFLYWSGGLSDVARIAGAQQLRKMIAEYKFSPGEKLNIIAHSHGGNVALAASHLGLSHKIDNLITLGTPRFHEDAYSPNMSNIGAWYNITGSGDGIQSAASDTDPSWDQPGAHNYVVPTKGFDHYYGNTAHTALWHDQGVRNYWWQFFMKSNSGPVGNGGGGGGGGAQPPPNGNNNVIR